VEFALPFFSIMNHLRIFLLSLVCGAMLLSITSCSVKSSQKHTFSIENGSFVYDGDTIHIYSGEMHFARIPEPYWRHRIQMAKSMGLNAIATYVFWNYHETAPGKWDWETGNHNIRKFIRICQEEGMHVILRPGPYCCAEWDFGGYPWWLQKNEELVLRTDNKPFLDSCNVYINQLMNQIRDLQVTHGGPIIMIQVENEFGSYVAQRKDIPIETHHKYSAAIKQQLLDAGADVNLFTSDGSWLFEGGHVEGAFPTANGESNVERLKDTVNKYHGGQGPYMVAEFYPGWLDHWNEPFNKVTAEEVASQTKKYIDRGVSFNFYMVHGGTNFGFWSGANYGNSKDIQPDLTSYDYDAPISEAGWPTPKYFAVRDILKRSVDYEVPQVPDSIPVIEIKNIELSKTVDIFSLIDDCKFIESDSLLTFAELNQGSGYVLYRRSFGEAVKGLMEVPGVADFGVVYVNGRKVGSLNRLTGKDSLMIDIPSGGVLDILVENFGHINYGARITKNEKGIIEPISIAGKEVSGGWKMHNLPMAEMPDMGSLPEGYVDGRAVLYGGSFKLDTVGDTFLNMEDWDKGIVFVNGINLGRYWKVGPQQTLYLPGCFLRKGDNQIVVFEQLNDVRQSAVSGIKVPVLEKLRY
jgi:beta-galactosidase